MSESHTVQQGEHLAAIAAQHGFGDYTVVWNHPENSSLKQLRCNPDVLLSGDTVTIPEKVEKQEAGATAQRHTFVLAQAPLMLRLLLEQTYGKPAEGAPCSLVIDGTGVDTTADGDGKVEHRISAALSQAILTVTADDSAYAGNALTLNVGELDPVEVLSGQVGRLANLGYGPGTPQSPDDLQFQSALQEFQCDYKLLVDGDPGPKTQAKLQEVHGC